MYLHSISSASDCRNQRFIVLALHISFNRFTNFELVTFFFFLLLFYRFLVSSFSNQHQNIINTNFFFRKRNFNINHLNRISAFIVGVTSNSETFSSNILIKSIYPDLSLDKLMAKSSNFKSNKKKMQMKFQKN